MKQKKDQVNILPLPPPQSRLEGEDVNLVLS